MINWIGYISGGMGCRKKVARMSKSNLTEVQESGVYAMIWQLIEIMVGRYGSFPTGHLFTVLTLVLLDRAGHHPTVGELAEITGLAKSTVSRYVSIDMKTGFIEEVIDSNDRRQRRLHPTQQSRDEQAWQMKKIMSVLESSNKAYRSLGETADPVADLKKILSRAGRNT
jgi:DNA-binding MarR family transcriptional regulator